MAKKELADIFVWLFASLLLITVSTTQSKSVFNFESLEGDINSLSVSHHKVFRRDTPGNDAECNSQRHRLDGLLSGTVIDSRHNFENETKYAMALAWAGKNDGILLIVTTEEVNGVPTESTLYRSQDFGKNYQIIEDVIQEPIIKHNGLQRNTFDAKKVYLIGGSGDVLYVTEDGGINFTKHSLPFKLFGEIIFHTHEKYDKYLLAQDFLQNLFVSFDNGKAWSKIASNTGKVYWGIVPSKDEPSCDTEMTMYATISPISITTTEVIYSLKKSSDGGKHWTALLENVVTYERKGMFLYASVIRGEDNNLSSKRFLKISVDCGATWNEAQLPSIEPDRFFSVMDIESNMIFMHVDNPFDSGHGTLYTSSTTGVVYSESLPRHLYPNYGEIHDFYKVKSMRGVYITSQMNVDDSIHSVITFNRGATWEKIKRPVNVPCKDETKECFLQIHGMYSIKRNINTSPPMSEETAIGLIVAHGHVADALQRTDPDVFVSSDGGYNWRLMSCTVNLVLSDHPKDEYKWVYKTGGSLIQVSLKGPHHYQIGDHGGLLVAIPREPEPKMIKFSTDEGRCWHQYNYTNQPLKFTGLLTEPEGKSLVVMIWGYLSDTKKWEVHVIDFKDVIKQQCAENDYEPWVAHESYAASDPGCLLGMKEIFLRLKKDSFCYNGYYHPKTSSQNICSCTREDYECDYGYYRPGGSEECVKIQEFTSPDIDICLRGHEEKLVSEGYRKIPGDKCSGGFTPSSRIIDLNVVCSASYDNFKTSETQEMGRGVKIFAVILLIIVLALAAVMGVYFMRKYILLRKHRVEYRYSMLNQNEAQITQDNGDWSDDLDNALSSSSINYRDSDEEELTTNTIQPSSKRAQSARQPARQNGSVKPKDTNPFGSYHDDSDDDLLS